MSLNDSVASNSSTTPQLVFGWFGSPNIRGTWDIVWSCVVTVFVCTYTLLCLNVPAPTDSSITLIRRRIKWMALAIIGPEIVLTYAAGQWSRAKQSVDAFRLLGYNDWTMRKAFFADMGGFILCPRDSDPFPVNAKQLHWLVANGHVAYPEKTQEEIWDKSKQDSLAKIITSFQVGYLIIDCIGRAVQRLAITTLELNTIGIVVCSLMTAFTWLHKSSDVHHPFRLEIDAKIEDVVGSRGWKTTPLDFIDGNGPGWAMNVQPFMNMPVIPAKRPIQRIPNDRFPTNPYGVQEYCLCFATLLFTGIHVAGWNFTFPTKVEQILWRVSSLILFGVTVAFWVLETMASWKRLGRWKWLYLRATDPARLEDFEKARAERLDHDVQRELENLPLPWEFWTILPVAILYGLARLYMIVEGFTSLRYVEATTYDTVNWATYLPHI